MPQIAAASGASSRGGGAPFLGIHGVVFRLVV
jgi:hypothetical protein